MGAEPEQFSAGAKKLVEAGFDVIDINFGCPVKKVLGRCRGGFHLGQPHVALEIVKRTRDVVPPNIPVTLKMRRGVDDSEASQQQFFEILDGAFKLGIDAVTVHGRTVVQRYIGPSRWEFLRQVKEHVGEKTILGSGDLFSAEDCVRMLRHTSVDGVTVARGAIGNPWIFAQARALLAGEPLPPPPRLRQQAAVIDEHYRLATEIYGDRGAQLMRKFGVKYAALHPRYADVRAAFVKVRSLADVKRLLAEWYSRDDVGQYPPREIHQVQGKSGES
jgi:nifR3 family TIM-barrel protein